MIGDIVETKLGVGVVHDTTSGGNLIVVLEDGTTRTFSPTYVQSTGRTVAVTAAVPAKKRTVNYPR